MRVLFIGGQNIFGKINNGGIQCSKRNYDLLRESVGKGNLYSAIIWNSKENIDNNIFFSRNETGKDSFAASLHLCRLYKFQEEKKIIKYINRVQPSIVFIDTSLFGRLIKKINKEIKTIIFFHNVETNYILNQIKNNGLIYIPALFATIYNERIATKYADKVICLNNRDADVVWKYYKRKVDYLLPISFQDRFDLKKVCKDIHQKTLLFVGSNFQPNYKGVKWFVEEVMSELKEFTLLIVGKDFENERRSLEKSNVRVIGTVDNLENYYYKYTNIVMPIFYGDGMKVKTAEAMMYGMNIFATAEALEGYDISSVNGIFRCNTKDEFIDNIRHNSEEEINRLCNEEIRECFLRKHSFNGQIDLMRKILKE